MPNEWLKIILTALIAYLLGSINTGMLVARAGHVNIREIGSGNPGASNVLRTMGLKKGIITFLGDAFKACLACLVGILLLGESTFGIEKLGIMVAGLFVTLGHDWPVFFRFRGGKGVACSVAILLFMDPLLGGIAIAACLAVMAVFRYISPASMTMLLVFLLENLFFHWGDWVRILFCFILFVLCVWRHRGNIRRLLAGQERKIGSKE